ncbi:hypothetical protein DIPPA_20878 [Diplonema papillatum]|nr:hypothetical protein DIPPA_20878 [Diplonema papillatum]
MAPGDAEARRQQREKTDYDNIYMFMQSQLAYMKRNISTAAVQTQTEWSIDSVEIDTSCLTEVSALLQEEAYSKLPALHSKLIRKRLEVGAAVEEPRGYRLHNCLMHSPKLLDVLATVSEAAVRVLDGRSYDAGSKQLIYELAIKELNNNWEAKFALFEEEKRAEAEKLTAEYAAREAKVVEDAVEALREEMIVRMKKLEQLHKLKMETLQSDHASFVSQAKFERERMEKASQALELKISQLESLKSELETVVHVKCSLIEQMKQQHLQHDLLEKERAIEAAARASTAAMAMKMALEGKDKQMDEVKRSSDQVVRRLKDTFTIREETLKRGADEMAGKVTALQQERGTLMRLHSDATKKIADEYSREARRAQLHAASAGRKLSGSFSDSDVSPGGFARAAPQHVVVCVPPACFEIGSSLTSKPYKAYPPSPPSPQPPSRRPCSAPSCRRKIR